MIRILSCSRCLVFFLLFEFVLANAKSISSGSGHKSNSTHADLDNHSLDAGAVVANRFNFRGVTRWLWKWMLTNSSSSWAPKTTSLLPKIRTSESPEPSGIEQPTLHPSRSSQTSPSTQPTLYPTLTLTASPTPQSALHSTSGTNDKSSTQSELQSTYGTNGVSSQTRGKSDSGTTMFGMLRPKNDMFSKLKDCMPDESTNVFSPQQLIGFVQVISNKLYAGRTLSSSEARMWECAKDKIVEELKTRNCNIFFAEREYKLATCCVVLTMGKKFGFCTYLELLNVSVTNTGLLLLEERKLSSGGLSVPLSRQYHRRKYQEPEANDVIYIDLFAVPCDPPIDDSLCSQFCCSPDNNDSYFCNSWLECY